MSNMSSHALNEAIAAARTGRRDDATRMLRDVIADEPNNADAWTWLAGVTPDLHEQRTSLERAIDIDPNNRRAQQGMAWLRDHHPELWESSSAARSLAERSTPPYEQDALPGASVYDAPTQAMPVIETQPPIQRDAFVVPPEQTDRMPAYTPPGAVANGDAYTDRMAVPPAAATAVRDSRGNLSRWLLIFIWLFGFGALATVAAFTITDPLGTATRIKSAVDPVLAPLNLQLSTPLPSDIIWYTIGLIAVAVFDFAMVLGLMFRARWSWITNLLVALLILAGTAGLITLAATAPAATPLGLVGTVVGWLPLLGLAVFALLFFVLSLTSRRAFFRPKLRPRPQPVQAYGR